MRPEKQNLTKEYLTRLNASPFFIVVNYKGLKVGHLTELRKRLSKAGAEIHIVKNSVFRIAAKEAGVAESQRRPRRPVGRGHRTSATSRPPRRSSRPSAPSSTSLKVQFGYLNNQRLEQADIMTLADLPSMEVLRGQAAGRVQRPGDQAGQVAQHAGQPVGPRAAGPGGQAGRSGPAAGAVILNRFHPRLSRRGWEQTNNNVNRRFAGSELKSVHGRGRRRDAMKGNNGSR